MAQALNLGPHREFMALLCKAAGLETHKVASISAHAGVRDAVRFDVQLIGEAERLSVILGEQAHMCADDSGPTRGIQAHEVGLEERQMP